MKNPRIIFLLVLFLTPAVFYGQQTLNGVWTGSMQNDSITAGKDQRFEITLTQYREKVYGYTRRTFIVNDTLYYMLKRVKGKIDGDVCEVTDDEIVAYSFPGKPDKKVKVTMLFRRNPATGEWSLSGKWNTNQVRNRYYSIGGQLTLSQNPDPAASEIISHLTELSLAKEMQTAFAGPSEIKTQPAAPSGSTSAITTNTKPSSVPAGTSTETVVKKSSLTPVSSKDSLANNSTTNKQAPAATPDTASQASATTNKQAPAVTPNPASQTSSTTTNNSLTSSTAGQSNTTAANSSKDSEVNPLRVSTSSQTTSLKPPLSAPPVKPAAPTAAADLVKRKNSMSQEVLFTSDSLELALYDNGEVDGDTVSVLLNGELILAKEVLKASALRKTILTPAGSNEFLLTLYAENLGRYPPNTGLLVVKDAEQTYQIRFSADLTQNAAIIFRRKPLPK